MATPETQATLERISSATRAVRVVLSSDTNDPETTRYRVRVHGTWLTSEATVKEAFEDIASDDNTKTWHLRFVGPTEAEAVDRARRGIARILRHCAERRRADAKRMTESADALDPQPDGHKPNVTVKITVDDDELKASIERVRKRALDEIASAAQPVTAELLSTSTTAIGSDVPHFYLPLPHLTGGGSLLPDALPARRFRHLGAL